MGGRHLYAYARPGQMVGHGFVDDVAVCRARSKREAVEMFRLLYGGATRADVKRVRFLPPGVCVLTDY